MLRILYGKILRILKKIPPEAAYRRYTEEIVKSRLQAVIDVSNFKLFFDVRYQISLRKLVVHVNKLLCTSKYVFTWRDIF